MLKDEQRATTEPQLDEPLTYASYLRVPELLSLQTPLGSPPVADEMLFIIVQQAQELWFKQILFDLRRVIGYLLNSEILIALSLLERTNRIMEVLGKEVAVLERLPPQEFQRFRGVLTPSSGFESEQFRELELASGLDDVTFIRLITKHMNFEALKSGWPVTLQDVFVKLLAALDEDVVEAVATIYAEPHEHQQLFLLCEALSEYEVLFGVWRFHHIKLVERAIGDHIQGTAGSSGAGYLGKTLGYRFFPQLWEARNRLSSRATGSV